jgi:8-oxo-dGTP pyrophosphatase MutT (NUDIX family)
MKKKLFWLVSRTAFGLYKRFPLFGDLRAAVAIIQDRERYLVIHRNDGRGYSFPGGISHPFEAEPATLLREVREETGLTSTAAEFLFRFRTDIDIPCVISVFRTQAHGNLADSWEGSPEWTDLKTLEIGVARSQKPIVDHLLQSNS